MFGSGTVQWSWGLDGFTTGKAVDKNMQQATVNLLADMERNPRRSLAGLVTAAGVDRYDGSDINHHVTCSRMQPFRTARLSP